MYSSHIALAARVNIGDKYNTVHQYSISSNYWNERTFL